MSYAAGRVRIDARSVAGSVAPGLYGQFLEHMFGGITGGLDAELLRDRGFDEPAHPRLGVALPWERDPDDRNEDAWLAIAQSAEHALPLEEIPEPAFVRLPSGDADRPRFAVRIDSLEADGRRRGIKQGGIPLRAGARYRASIWLRADDFRGRVVLALEADVAGGARYAAASFEGIGREWKSYEAELAPTASDPLAKLAILVEGEGSVYLDQASLTPRDVAPGCVRRDVFDKLDALRSGFLRWPGGNVAQDYRWLWGAGDRDRRVTWTNLSWKDAPEPSDFGTAEYVKLARALGSEPTICVNLDGRGATAAEAAAWVEYCNGPASSRWGSLRARHGDTEPYGVRWWELGNELWGEWVRGHCDAETYARRALEYAKAMRAVDPTIRLIGVGHFLTDWNRTVLSILGPHIDTLSIHHYYGREAHERDPLDVMARPLYYEKLWGETRDQIRELCGGRDVKVALNEWNLMIPGPRAHSIEAAVFAARFMNVAERWGDLVTMSCISDAVNGWNGGIIQASRHGVYVTGPYWANLLWGTHVGTERLATEIESPTVPAPAQKRDVPSLDVVATRDPATGTTFVKLVNADLERPIRVEIDIAGELVAREGTLSLLAAARDAVPDFDRPDAIGIATSSVAAGPKTTVELPACSAAVLRLS